MTMLCSIEGCHRPAKRKGWCNTHYERLRRTGDITRGRKPKKLDCNIDACSKPHFARGFCHIHYARWRAHGDPLAEVKEPGLGQKFLEEVALQYQGDDCLIWPFGRNTAGYGVFSNSGGTNIVARYICEQVHGAPPTEKHEARHLCGKGTSACISPKHVVWGTPHENQMDKVLHGTDIRGERHPLHKLTIEQAREALELKGIVPQKVLAERFGVARTTISHIHNGKTWAWL